MGWTPEGTVTDRPNEWLALRGGGLRPVVSQHGDDGDVELLPPAAWLARQRPLCACGSPRLGSGRTCGRIECIAELSQPPGRDRRIAPGSPRLQRAGQACLAPGPGP